MRLHKQDLSALGLDKLANLSINDVANWAKQQNFSNYSSWMLPQLVSIFGQWKLYSCGKTTLQENCKNDFLRGCWALTRIARSQLIKNQTKEPEYGTLTPLILLGFKRMQGYSYEQFRELPGLEWLLEPALYDALILKENPSKLTKERLLAIRQQGLIYRTGPKAGTTRDSTSTWQLYGIQDTELGYLPKVTQTIMCQIWLAHPQHRRETMILDLDDWDYIPESIIESELFTSKVVSKPSELPWLT